MRYFLTGLLLFIVCSSFSQHTVVLRSGEKMNGVVMEIKDDVLTIAVNRELEKVDMIKVSSIFFKEHVKYDGELMVDEKVKTMMSGRYRIEYRIKGRTMVRAPKVSVATEDKGVVVVDVVVNRTGHVISAKPGAVGSTTTNEYLYTKAKFAVQGAMFNAYPKGPLETKGTVTISY